MPWRARTGSREAAIAVVWSIAENGAMCVDVRPNAMTLNSRKRKIDEVFVLILLLRFVG